MAGRERRGALGIARVLARSLVQRCHAVEHQARPSAGAEDVVGKDRARGAGRAGPRVVEHELQALGGVAWVERQVGGAGLEDAEQGRDHLQRARHAQCHPVLRSDA